MIVNRRTFVYKQGCQKDAIELLQQLKDKARDVGAIRIYVNEMAPFNTTVLEIECENWEQYHKLLAESSLGDEWWEKWFSVIEPGGSNEMWRLAE